MKSHSLDEGATIAASKLTKFCGAGRDGAPEETHCRCEEGQGLRNQCIEIGEDPGFCFLQYVGDPANPTHNCFADVQWSPTDGRFWSAMACKSNKENKDKEL